MDNSTKDLKTVKFWPLLAMASWRSNKSGAFKVWSLAKLADPAGSGRVSEVELSMLLKSLSIPKNTANDWIRKAVKTGLFRKGSNGSYYPAGLAKGALILGCDRTGYPVEIDIKDFIGKGWKAYVWASWHTTLTGPVSQETKEQLTGVPIRTQSHYLKQVPLDKTTNYAKRSLPAESAYLIGYEEETGHHVFVNEQGEVIQKLPDYLTVPGSVATRANKGRSRKAQKKINEALFSVERGNRVNSSMRLWHTTRKGLEATIKRAVNRPLRDQQGDLFIRVQQLAGVSFWEPESYFTL